jgi:hypothetical protein
MNRIAERVSAGNCACRATSAHDCIRLRYPQQFMCDDASDDIDPEPCECACHDEWDADDED